MVQMSTPWKNPPTGIYYLYKAVPEHLWAEMTNKQIRRLGPGILPRRNGCSPWSNSNASWPKPKSAWRPAGSTR